MKKVYFGKLVLLNYNCTIHRGFCPVDETNIFSEITRNNDDDNCNNNIIKTTILLVMFYSLFNKTLFSKIKTILCLVLLLPYEFSFLSNESVALAPWN